MRSKAHFKSHPLHPILVAFPIGFLGGAFIFDVLSVIYTNDSFAQTGHYLIAAGVIAGIVAAIPGLVDLVSVVPPRSSGKKRGVTHGLINASVLTIFAISFFLRSGSLLSMTNIALEGVGLILMVIAGYMGGTLVYRNQIGVDIRYANAGKWKEEYVKSSSGKVEIGDVGELGENQMKLVHIKDKRIVLANTGDTYVAFDDHCTHRGGTLAGGSMICGTVQCPWHGSQFDVTTGAVKAGPAKESIKTYPIAIDNGKIFIDL